MKFANTVDRHYGFAKLTITSIAGVFVIIFYTIWTVKAIQHLIQSAKLYRINKRKDFRDSREQDRILYNYETHIVKDVILVILNCAEAGEVFGAITSAIFTTLQQHESVEEEEEYRKVNRTCTPHNMIGIVKVSNHLKDVVLYNLDLIEISIFPIGYIGFLILLSFLTHYLSKRYFYHPYKKSIIKHLLLFVTQATVIFILNNLETHNLNLIIAPILVMIDWCILVRNCRKLRSVLKSNVRDLDLHFTHRSLYREQLKLLQTYTVFMPILLTALFFGVLAIFNSYYTRVIHLFLRSNCEYQFQNFAILKKFIFVSKYGTLLAISIHFILLGLPLYAISIQILVSACLKRIRSKEEHFRFNYSTFSHTNIGNK